MLKNKHLIDPMDFTIGQLEEIFELAHQKNILMYVMEKFYQLYFMNLVQEQDSALNQQ